MLFNLDEKKIKEIIKYLNLKDLWCTLNSLAIKFPMPYYDFRHFSCVRQRIKEQKESHEY